MTRKAFKIPDVLNAEEQEQLLDQPNRKCSTGLRNFVIMKIMLDLGLRVSEVVKLKPADIDKNTGKLTVREGKGKRDRVLWLADNDLALIVEWWIRRPPSDFIFCTLKGGKVNDRYIRAMVDRCAKKAEIQKNVHPHTLRHSFATDLLRESKNIRLVQKSLGHADLSTTQIYTHIVDDELETALKTFRHKSAPSTKE